MAANFTLRLDPAPGAQHEEQLVVTIDGREQTMRLHEYDRVYSIPGLYDEVLRRVQYASPAKVAELLFAVAEPGEVRALDLAAGNGVSADPLLAGGIGGLVGMDLIPEARDSALRERPDAYLEYVAGDVGEPGLVQRLVSEYRLNALVCSGGISHIPVDAFRAGWAAFPPGAWLVATAREDMDDYAAGLEDVHTERFVHRLAFSGEPIEYTALRGRKPWS